jgi:hypothetical protein
MFKYTAEYLPNKERLTLHGKDMVKLILKRSWNSNNGTSNQQNQ